MKYILILLLTSCSFLSPKKEVPQNELADMSYPELKKYLKKTETMAGKTFYITATPLTPQYIKGSLENENILKFNNEVGTLLSEKTCFELDLVIDRPGKEEAARLENWQGYVLDSKGSIHFLDMKQTAMDIQKVPSKDYFGKSVAYKNEALACTDKLEIEDGLTMNLYLEKKIAPWPFSEKVSLNWIPIRFKKTESGKRFIEPKKKIKRKYRGW